jgi:purine nucleosidase
MAELTLFDCDNTLGLPLKEIDDGLALLYLLGQSEIELLGVTTTFGNGTVEQAYNQTRKLLIGLERPEIPLFQGAGRRSDGVTEAALFLARIVDSYPGQINLLAGGPLGNIRTAAELNPKFYSQLKQMVIMGGCKDMPRIGWRSLSEINFAKDPVAAHNVLNAPCKKTVFSMEICLQSPIKRNDIKRTGHWPAWLRRSINNWMLTFGAYCGVSEFYPCGLLPAVYLNHPTLFSHKSVRVISDIINLETGHLLLDDEENGNQLNLPDKIQDPSAMLENIFHAWEKALNIN